MSQGEHRRFRVGYFSSGFGPTPISFMVGGLMALHNRTRFEVWCYANGVRGGGDGEQEAQAHREAVQAQVRCDHFVDVHKLQADEVAALFERDGIQLLVNIDGVVEHRLGPANAFLYRDRAHHGSCADAGGKVARARTVAAFGFTGASSNLTMDWTLTDTFTSPPELVLNSFDEKLLFLPSPLLPFDLSISRTDQTEEEELVDEGWQRIEQLLAQAEAAPNQQSAPMVLLATHNPYKIDRTLLSAYANLLRRLPSAVLVLKPRGGHQTAGRVPGTSTVIGAVPSTKTIHAVLHAHGISAHRCICIGISPGRSEYFRQLRRLRGHALVLDTPGYNAHSTAVEALRAGLPIVALAGRSMAGRLSSSLANFVGTPETVVHSYREYEEVALALGWSGVKRAAASAAAAVGAMRAPRAMWTAQYERLLVSSAALDVDPATPMHIWTQQRRPAALTSRPPPRVG